jgi:hypothetical protein
MHDEGTTGEAGEIGETGKIATSTRVSEIIRKACVEIN